MGLVAIACLFWSWSCSQVERLLEHAYGAWTGFDAFALHEATQGHALSVLSFFLLHRTGLTATLGLNRVRLARFLREVENGYNDNPYHNK